MSSNIKAAFGSPTALTITLASLGSSTSGVGRQSTIVDNTTNLYLRVYVYYSIKLGTSPTSNAPVTIYLLRSDNNAPIITDGAGTSDAALTVKNAQTLEIATTGGSATTGDVLSGSFVIENPGPKWGIAVVNSSGVALNGTGGNHSVIYVGENLQSV